MAEKSETVPDPFREKRRTPHSGKGKRIEQKHIRVGMGECEFQWVPERLLEPLFLFCKEEFKGMRSRKNSEAPDVESRCLSSQQDGMHALGKERNFRTLSRECRYSAPPFNLLRFLPAEKIKNTDFFIWHLDKKENPHIIKTIELYRTNQIVGKWMRH